MRSRIHPSMVPMVLTALVLAGGCDRQDQARVYIAPKDSPPPSSAAAMAPPPEHDAPIHLTLPPGWTEQPGGNMRYAWFQVGPAQDQLELTVVPLPQDAGSTLDQVNRWRGQLGLAAIGAEELDRLIVRFPLPQAEATLCDLAGPPEASGQPGKRMLAAIVPYAGLNWFFKMVGPAALVEKHAQEFSQFVASIRFADLNAP